jgi:hypothetical protein
MTTSEKQALNRTIEAGVKASIARALAEHKRLGQSIVIWRDGQVVTVPASEIDLPIEDGNSGNGSHENGCD